MKKRLLFAALAMICASSTFAYEEGEYAFTKDGRVRIDGQNLVVNGDFTDELKGWTGAVNDAPNSDAWGIEPGAGPNGENAVKSKGTPEGSEDNGLCQVISLEPGTYVASYQIQATGETLSGTTSVGTTVGSSYADFFLNTDGALTRVESTAEANVAGIAAAQNFNDQWTTVNYFFEVADSVGAPTFLVIRFENIVTDGLITNVSVNPATEVYDIRIAQAKVAYAKMLLNDENFNTAEAQESHDYLLNDIIPAIEGEYEGDGDQLADMLKGFDDALAAYLDVTSINMSGQLVGIDFSALANVGRGRGWTAATVSNIRFQDGAGNGNWGKVAEASDVLMSAIQTGQKGHTAKIAFFNTDFPAGKYFFTAEIRNSYTGKGSWPCPEKTFTLETVCQVSIGETTVDTEPIVGEAYQRIYLVAEVGQDGAFEASVYWPGNPNGGDGGAFFIRNCEVRYFGGQEVFDAIEHTKAWRAFKAQYDAAVSRQNTIAEMQGNRFYPWQQHLLQEALDTYAPYFHITDGWVDANGEDTGVATTEELNNWANYQGGEVPEDGKATYYVVRGYSAAIDAVKAANQSIADLQEEITFAYQLAGNAMYYNCDKGTFLVAVTKAQNTLQSVLSTTNDNSSEADAATLVEALEELKAAEETFKNSGTLVPFVDIDFSEAPVSTDTGYVIKGAAGEMTFTDFDPEHGNNYSFCQGWYSAEDLVLADVLHVGGDSYGEVVLPEAVTESDAVTFSFDLWYGQLGKAFQYVDLVNAAGERVAGFSIDSYNSNVEYNDFDNEAGTGMVIKGKIKSNHDKSGGAASVCTEALTNSFELTVDYGKKTVKGSLRNSSNNIVGVEVPLNQTEGFDNIITAFRVGGRNHNKANGSAFGRRAWFDNLKAYKYPVVNSIVGDVNGDGVVDVADISNVITIMADGTNAAAGDVNGDGSVDVADISSIITIMSNQ